MRLNPALCVHMQGQGALAQSRDANGEKPLALPLGSIFQLIVLGSVF